MNYRQQLCVLFFLCSILTTVQAQWINQPSDTLLRAYETVFMLDGETGWIGGDYGSILKTTDGGGSWFLQKSTSSQFDDVSKIIFADKSNGFCLAPTNSTASLFTTTDGGGMWLEDTSLFNLTSDSLVSPTQLFLTKSGDSVLVCVFCIGYSGMLPATHTALFFSKDLGNTWTLGKLPPVGNQNIWGDAYPSLSSEVMLTQNSAFRSIDHGNTWQQDSLAFGPNGLIMSFRFLNPDTGYFAGSTNASLFNSPSMIGWTNDGGATWTIDTTTSLEGLMVGTVFFTSVNNGFAVKWNVPSIFSTSDGGKTWKESQLSNGIPPLDVCSADGQTVVAAGAGGEILVSKDSGATWLDLTPPQKIYFSSVKYLSSDLVAAIGNSFDLFISKDSCKSWTMHTLASGLNAVIAFGDTLNCWICDDSSRIYHSPDLGISWTFQNEHNVPAPALYGIHFFNDSSGCAVGAMGYITATTNGGAVWTTTSNSPHNLYGVFVASRARAWAVGDAGTIITTSNAFNSWTPQSSPTNVTLRSVSFSDTLNGYILGDNGTMLKTTDGGTTWSLAQSPASTLNAMKFISTNEGWVVGDSGKIFTTSTGGANWVSQVSGVTAKLLSVDFLDAQNGITIGNGGIILTTKNGGITGVRTSQGTVPTSVTLEQNYPNPFNPTTTISFAIPSRSLVSLKVFDVLGREVSTILSEELQAGSYTRQWNASAMASGIYFYRLQAGTFTETKKLLLLK
jgi:photosystem II stability/assembly factor-like uncharacterized protein